MRKSISSVKSVFTTRYIGLDAELVPTSDRGEPAAKMEDSWNGQTVSHAAR
jgi:hypothetical protein